MTTPLEKIAEEKTGNYQSSLKGGGGGVPLIGKRPIYFRFFLLKASLSNVVFSHAYTFKELLLLCHFWFKFTVKNKMKMFSRIYLECQGINMLRIMSITKNIKWKIYKSKLLFL